MLYLKIKEKKEKTKLSMSNKLNSLKQNILSFIHNFKTIDYLILFLNKSFHF